MDKKKKESTEIYKYVPGIIPEGITDCVEYIDCTFIWFKM